MKKLLIAISALAFASCTTKHHDSVFTIAVISEHTTMVNAIIRHQGELTQKSKTQRVDHTYYTNQKGNININAKGYGNLRAYIIKDKDTVATSTGIDSLTISYYE